MNLLNTYDERFLSTSFMALIALVVIAIVVILIFREKIEEFLNLKFGFKKIWNLTPYILSVVLFTALCCLAPMFMETSTYVECTIDHGYSVVNLYEHYEILERRGDIWVLRQLSEPTEEEEK